MIKPKKMLLLVASAALVTSCEEVIKKEKPLDKLSWLEGEWFGVTDDVVMQENWSKVSDELYSGHAYVLSGEDTLFQEFIRLEVVNDTAYYVVFIPGIPDSTSFQLVKYNNGEAIFENPEHDYPQRVVYKQIGSDSLYAYIEGEAAGKVQKDEFWYKRITAPPQENATEK